MQSLPPRKVRLPDRQDLVAARECVLGTLPPTPLVDIDVGGRKVLLKLESLQPTGSFKVRGALAAASRVPPGQRIIAVSAGNHALGIAWASARLEVPATVVLAETASPAKLAALRRFPIEVITHGSSYDEAEAYALALVADAGEAATFVSAYNDPHVIAGQATVLEEILALTGDTPLDVVVPAGGGGLLAGVALRALDQGQPSPVTVVGVEAAASMAVSAAVTAGRAVAVPVGDTLADGLAGNLEPGSVTVDVIGQNPVRMTSVTEGEIAAAIRFLASSAGIVAEGAGAAALAAVLAGKAPVRDGAATVVLVTGRNIALPKLAAILSGP